MTERASPIRILAVDDHPVLRDGISALINNDAAIELVGEGSNGREAVALFRQLLPDVTLMDLQMPQMNGLEAIRQIRHEFPAAKIIVLTTFPGDVLALQALKAGASAYVLKTSVRRYLLATIFAVHRGSIHIQDEIADEIAQHAGEPMLTSREVEVLTLVAGGYSNGKIARHLKITDETVKGHVSSILGKLSASDRTHAVSIAVRRGIIGL